MHDVSVTGAAPVWLALVDYLHRGPVSNQPQRPQPVVARRLDAEDLGSADFSLLWILDGTN